MKFIFWFALLYSAFLCIDKFQRKRAPELNYDTPYNKTSLDERTHFDLMSWNTKKTRVVKTTNQKEENAFQRTNKNAKLKKTLWSAGNANDQVLRRTDFFFF